MSQQPNVRPAGQTNPLSTLLCQLVLAGAQEHHWLDFDSCRFGGRAIGAWTWRNPIVPNRFHANLLSWKATANRSRVARKAGSLSARTLRFYLHRDSARSAGAVCDACAKPTSMDRTTARGRSCARLLGETYPVFNRCLSCLGLGAVDTARAEPVASDHRQSAAEVPSVAASSSYPSTPSTMATSPSARNGNRPSAVKGGNTQIWKTPPTSGLTAASLLHDRHVFSHGFRSRLRSVRARDADRIASMSIA